MHPVLTSYLKLQRDLLVIEERSDLDYSDRERLTLVLTCPFCARANERLYRIACDHIAAVLKENGFDLSVITEQLNELYQKTYHGEAVAVLGEDGNSIDFVNGCTNGVYDILEIAAELIEYHGSQ